MARPRLPNVGLGQGALALVSAAYSVFRWAVLRLDEKRAITFGTWVTGLCFAAVKKKRGNNYRAFFGTADPARDKKIEAGYNAGQGRMFVENIRDAETSFDVLRARCEFLGREHIDAALALGRGAILLGSHMGNFYAYHEMIPLQGYRLTNVMARLPVASMEAQVGRLREKFKVTSVYPDEGAARAAVKTLRRNELFSIVFDAPIRPEKAVVLPFGAGNLHLDIGPARLAARLGVPVLPVNIYSERPYEIRLHVLPPFPAAQGETEEARALHLLGLWRDWLQDEVKKRPEQWCAWSFVNVGTEPAQEPA